MVPRTVAATAGRCYRRRGSRALRVLPVRQDPRARRSASGTARQRWLSSVGFADTVTVDEEMAHPDGPAEGPRTNPGKSTQLYLVVLLFAAAVYAGCMISPPSLMDDVDAVQAQISRNMLTSGDWVTARLDGIPYLEKAPLIYWLIGASFQVFGASDWAARVPMVLAALALAWLTTAFGVWAFGGRAG